MEINNEMLQAAIRKAVEAGLLPRHASPEEMRINRDLMRVVLQAAMDQAPSPSRYVSKGERFRPAADLPVFRPRFAGSN